MTRDQLKARILASIDRRASDIIAIGERIRKNPELGFKEVKTARLVEETFRSLGLSPRAGLAFTGVRADVPGARLRVGIGMAGHAEPVELAQEGEGGPGLGAAHACG